MKTNKNTKLGMTLVEILVVVAIIGILFSTVFCRPFLGVFPFGPEKVVEAKVERLYVDYGGGEGSSYYMVGTDQGVFEVDNSIWLGIYDADETYSKLKEGKSYFLRTKGNKVIGMFFQEYPVIIMVAEIEE